jgi:Bacterial Ig domain/Lysyl oxidase
MVARQRLGRLAAAGRRRTAALLTAAALAPLAGLVAIPALSAAAAATVTPPDMLLRVPRQDISIGINSGTGHRQLQFTHVTWDGGRGPFEIDPAYNSATGTAGFAQAIYNSPRRGVWHFDHSVPLAVTGVFNPPFDYRFPLTSFTLNRPRSDGSAGRVVAVSPKTDYCITGDTFVGGVPNSPGQTFIPQRNCTTPTKPLGWSVGWGDEYDQTDDGQPIDLTGVANGTYILQGTVDPEHVLTESNRRNDVVDTRLRIRGDTVTVGRQTRPSVTPPGVALTSPARGARVSGSVRLRARASARSPARVSSVQFLLDGHPLGSPDKSAPYSRIWRVGSTPLGRHLLSARVTDSRGSKSTAPVRAVTVVSGGGARGARGLALAATVTRTGKGEVSTRRFSTAAAGETLVAFVSSDGPAGRGTQTVTVSGAGLTWRRVQRSNAHSGDSEIWTATATRRLRRVTVTSRPARRGHDQQLTVLAFRGSGGVGASARATAATGGPSVHLVTRAAGSLSYAVGNDYDSATARTVGSGQALVSQWVDRTTGDTYWVQGRTSASSAARKSVLLSDSAPATDQWNMAAVEIKPSRVAAAGPAADIVNPAPGQTVAGTIPVAADASDGVSVSAVQFFLDGKPLGQPVTAPPYAVRWHTTAAAAGAHTLSARATGAGGLVARAASVRVTVQNPAAYVTCFIMQAVSAHGHGAVTTRPFHTAAAGETLLAFASSDGPQGAHGPVRQSVQVSGAGLHWSLVARANSQSGDAEIWQAKARRVIPDAKVTSRQSRPGYGQELTVIAMQDTDGVGASARASAASGAPSLRLTTTKDISLVFAVGSDQGNEAARRLPVGWVMLHQRLGAGSSWSQYTNVPVREAGTVVRVRDTAPTGQHWNLAAVELTAGSG